MWLVARRLHSSARLGGNLSQVKIDPSIFLARVRRRPPPPPPRTTDHGHKHKEWQRYYHIHLLSFAWRPLLSSRDRDSNTIFVSSSPDKLLGIYYLPFDRQQLSEFETTTTTTQGLAVAGQGPAANQERATAESPNHQLIPANNNSSHDQHHQ